MTGCGWNTSGSDKPGRSDWSIIVKITSTYIFKFLFLFLNTYTTHTLSTFIQDAIVIKICSKIFIHVYKNISFYQVNYTNCTAMHRLVWQKRNCARHSWRFQAMQVTCRNNTPWKGLAFASMYRTDNVRRTKIKLYKSLVISVLLYGSETWKIIVDNKKLDTFHFTYIQRILQIRWPYVISNDNQEK